MTELQRLFVIEAIRLMRSSYNHNYCDEMVHHLASHLPEVQFGSGNVGDKHPFDFKPRYRRPIIALNVIISQLRSSFKPMERLWRTIRKHRRAYRRSEHST